MIILSVFDRRARLGVEKFNAQHTLSMSVLRFCQETEVKYLITGSFWFYLLTNVIGCGIMRVLVLLA
jgi:hypothetical protein